MIHQPRTWAVALLFVVAAASSQPNQPPPGLSGNELLKGDDLDIAMFSFGFLMGHVQGAATMRSAAIVAGASRQKLEASVREWTLICPPRGVTGKQAALVLKKWLNDNPARLHESSRALAADAFSVAWPCE